MVTLDSILEEVNNKVELLLEQCNYEPASRFGLDERCGSLYTDGDSFVAVKVSGDKRLQYYGGFEYVEKNQRVHMGEYVFYCFTSNDERVGRALDHYNSEAGEE